MAPAQPWPLMVKSVLRQLIWNGENARNEENERNEQARRKGGREKVNGWSNG